MDKKTEIRMAAVEDAKELLQIYAPYCTDTVITFEYEAPALEEFAGRICTVQKKYPYLVAVQEGNIVGYAYASQHKSRAAYQWNVETSIYVDRNCQAKGIGTLLYEKLMALLQKQNIRNVYACVTLPNDKSERIHGKFGFKLIGRFQAAGYKCGAWHEVGWFEKRLECNSEVPEPVIPIGEIAADKIIKM